ncbi:POK9 protein, partial [Pachycephala philippinensis]|nr:POK9 protein [Pachycephala philippinensis]
CMPKEVGKLETQREQQPRGDTSSSCDTRNDPISQPHQLHPATVGSLGLDLAASIDVDILTTQLHKVPTGIHGPILIDNRPTGGLIIGRSSATIMGLFVEPGVIDADTEGELIVLVHTLYPPVTIPKGQRIAQFVPLPQLTKNLSPLIQQPRREGNFGSTGRLTLLTIDLHTRPKSRCQLIYQGHTIALQALLDTGADSSVLDATQWPTTWPLQSSLTPVAGIGGMTLAKRTPLVMIEIEGKRASTTLSVTTLPPTVHCLIGRDVLAQLGLVL